MSIPAVMLCARMSPRISSTSSSSHSCLRRLHTTPIRFAAPPPSPSATPKSPRPSASGSAAAPPAASGETASRLRWRPMKSRQKDVIAEERILFVRPFEVGEMGKSRWALPVFALALGVYGTGFAVYELSQSNQEPDIRTYKGWFDNASKFVTDWIGPPCFIAIALVVYKLAKGHFGTITRLSQVRITPVTADGVRGEPKEFTRLVHGGHLIGLGIFPRYRDIETDKIHLFRKSESFIRLDIDGKGLWNKDLQMFMRDSELLQMSKDEVVVSIRRLDEALGPIRVKTKQELYDERPLRKRFDQLFGYDPMKSKAVEEKKSSD